MIKNRTELAKYFNELGFRRGAEIGACLGYYSKILCENIPALELIAVDNWNNSQTKRREQILGISAERHVRNLLAPYSATVIKKNSMDAAKDIPEGFLDFVFIDAAHDYRSVAEDIREWSKKVRTGGIVSGHDYYIFPHSGNRGVIDAVDDFVKERGIELFTTAWDRKNPVSDDRQPCWYFFKR